METTMTIKGQVVIPARIRKRLGVKKGVKLHIEERDGEIILRPLDRQYFERMAGVLKGAGLLDSLAKSKAEALESEEAELGRSKGSR
jgi:AbrB family looped-hinge helix DNA binding protein